MQRTSNVCIGQNFTFTAFSLFAVGRIAFATFIAPPISRSSPNFRAHLSTFTSKVFLVGHFLWLLVGHSSTPEVLIQYEPKVTGFGSLSYLFPRVLILFSLLPLPVCFRLFFCIKLQGTRVSSIDIVSCCHCGFLLCFRLYPLPPKWPAMLLCAYLSSSRFSRRDTHKTSQCICLMATVRPSIQSRACTDVEKEIMLPIKAKLWYSSKNRWCTSGPQFGVCLFSKYIHRHSKKLLKTHSL